MTADGKVALEGATTLNRSEDSSPSEGEVESLAQFPNLRIFGVNSRWSNTFKRINPILPCKNLRALLITGGTNISRDDLLRFATVISQRKFSKLRKVKSVSTVLLKVERYDDRRPFRYSWFPSVTKDPSRNATAWRRLHQLVEKSIPQFLRARNVEFVFQKEVHEDRARPFVPLWRWGGIGRNGIVYCP
ncbi:hypothetical protein VTI74DRAFT_5193 [Chaetomium olivicolor]